MARKRKPKPEAPKSVAQLEALRASAAEKLASAEPEDVPVLEAKIVAFDDAIAAGVLAAKYAQQTAEDVARAEAAAVRRAESGNEF